MHVPMSVVECLLRVYHYHTSIYRLEGKLRVRSFISLLEKNGGFQKMTWEFLWKTFFDFMTSIGRSGVASKRFLYEWHMRNNSNWFLGRRSFVPQTPFFCNDCYRTITFSSFSSKSCNSFWMFVFFCYNLSVRGTIIIHTPKI